jgi:predicted dehydrogenase
MLEQEELDAVSIATPPALHREMVVAAMEAGADVLVEKPLAPMVEDVEAMISAAERFDRIAMVQQTLRYNPTFWRAAELVRAGEIGEIRRVHGALLNLGPRAWAPDSQWFFDKDLAGGGVILDSGVHMVDLVRHMTGANVAELHAELVYPQADGMDEEAALVAWLDNGVQATIDLSWHVDPPQVSIALYGSEGFLQADAKSVTPIAVHRKDGSMWLPAVERPTWYGRVYQHFVDCCIERNRPMTSVADNRHTIAPLLSLYDKATTRRRYRA